MEQMGDVVLPEYLFPSQISHVVVVYGRNTNHEGSYKAFNSCLQSLDTRRIDEITAYRIADSPGISHPILLSREGLTQPSPCLHMFLLHELAALQSSGLLRK